MNEPGSGGERRAARRYKVRYRVRWARAEGAEVDGEVSDLSVGGCFVISGERVREGDLVKLKLEIPGHEGLTILGERHLYGASRGIRGAFRSLRPGRRARTAGINAGRPRPLSRPPR